MGFALLGKLQKAALLTVLLLALWKTVTVAKPEPQLHPTCTLNQTEEEAQFQGDLTHTSGRGELKGFTEDQNGNDQRVFPSKVTGQNTSRREKERPKVFANPRTEYALEGEEVILVCESYSYPSIDSWKWYRYYPMEDYVLLLNSNGQRVFIIESAHRSELLLRHVDTSKDSGQYICVGTNSEGYHAAVVMLKVRRRLSAFWPFLGILFEVLVLFTIILLNGHNRTLAEEFIED